MHCNVKNLANARRKPRKILCFWGVFGWRTKVGTPFTWSWGQVGIVAAFLQLPLFLMLCHVQVMVAEALDISRETYFAILMDRSCNGPVMVGSPQGGMDIEEVAANSPELIFKVFNLHCILLITVSNEKNKKMNCIFLKNNAEGKIHWSCPAQWASLTSANPLAIFAQRFYPVIGWSFIWFEIRPGLDCPVGLTDGSCALIVFSANSIKFIVLSTCAVHQLNTYSNTLKLNMNKHTQTRRLLCFILLLIT